MPPPPRWLMSVAAAAAATTVTASPWACQPPHANYSFCSPGVPPSVRLASLVALLSDADLANNVWASPGSTGGSSALGVPATNWWAEATHGASNRAGYPTTYFPMPSLTACAWNLSLVRDIANTVGREGRAASNLGHNGFNFWAPNVNLVRDPRWGRAQEVAGEDPTLNSAWATAYVRGLQEGDAAVADPRYLQVIATPKHVAVYSFEGQFTSPINRDNFDARVSPQDLADTYLVPFQAAYELGHAAGAMCSYTSINGVPACANRWLLTDVLRQAWGFSVGHA